MKTLSFQGHSDDTFACTGDGIDVDYDNCASGTPIYMRVEAGSESLVVAGQYCFGPFGGWSIAVGPDDLGVDASFPPWGIRLTAPERGYTPLLEIDAPDNVGVVLVDKFGKELSHADQ